MRQQPPTGIQLTDIDTANGSFTLVWEQPQAALITMSY